MKIIFVCSCLEPGRDGVGDYTGRLAAELIRIGHEVCLLALNDRFATTILSDDQERDGVKIQVLRLPSTLSNQDKKVLATNWINTVNPDLLSLQFVPFGFNPKGLPFGLGKLLLSISKGRKWQITFHELWVGMAKEESKKLFYWGLLQRYIIKSLIRDLKPVRICTQTHLYKKLLEDLGFAAALLPLFGNIAPGDKGSEIANKKEIRFVVFGLIHSGAPIDQFAQEAAIYAKQNNVAIKLIFIGRCGNEQERWLNIWESQGLTAEVFGEQPAEKISAVLWNATMGISATATAVIEKSGSVAAMRNHGLPVLSLSKPWTPRGVAMPPVLQGVVLYKTGNFKEYADAIKGKFKGYTVTDIATKFIESLKNV